MIRKLVFGALALALAATFVAVHPWELEGAVAGARAAAFPPPATYQRVVYVYDGDTVQLADGRRVRLLNINAPEIKTHSKRGEPSGEPAKRALERLTRGKRVRLEYDAQTQDHYGRTLAYLFTEDGLHVNLTLVKQGFAVANLHPPNLKYAEAILAAEREAEAAKRGVWGMAAYAPKPIEVLRRTKVYGWQRVQGRVRRIKPLRKFIRLEFDRDLYVTIPKANLKWFPPLSTYLEAKLEVRAWPKRRGQSVSMLVRHPSALVVLR
ncbi:MAG: thermonuclease family protein [Methylohalobius sp.]